MQLNDLIAYTSLLIALTLAPGPLIAVTISRSLRKDTVGALSFVIGVAAGDVIIIVMICAGLGMWLQSFPAVFAFAKFASLTYLLYIAYGMWCGSDRDTVSQNLQGKDTLSDVIAGMMTCMVSPQTILIYLILLPRLIDIADVSKSMIGFVAVFTFAVITMSFSVIVLLACRLNTYSGVSNHKIILSRTLSLVICVSGFWMVTT